MPGDGKRDGEQTNPDRSGRAARAGYPRPEHPLSMVGERLDQAVAQRADSPIQLARWASAIEIDPVSRDRGRANVNVRIQSRKAGDLQ